jgi:hypothetical protein
MRLGKEKATGYVEDAETDSTLGEETEISQPERTELTPELHPAATVS